MNFKKLIPELVSGIQDAGYEKDAKVLQNLGIPKIKSGADLFLVAPDGAGKSSTLVMGIIQRLKAAFEEAPRAIVMVADRQKADEMEELFATLSTHTNLRTFTVFDNGILQYQKDMIYEGIDVLIGTPKRISELLNVMGIPMVKIQIFAIDDVQSISLHNYGKYIYRIADGIEKAQFIIATTRWSENMGRISERIMKGEVRITADE